MYGIQPWPELQTSVKDEYVSAKQLTDNPTGQGIQFSIPGQTHHGRPMEVIPLGVTSLPEEVFLEYLDSLKSIYSHEAYDLFQHNCNNFTNDVSQFLCGRSIDRKSVV